MSQADDLRHRRAVRLTFRYHDGDVELVEREPLNIPVPPSDPATGPAGEHGFWVELRSADGRALYRRVGHDPFRQDVEVFSADPDRPVARVPQERRSGTFIVDVPDTVDSDHLVLFSSHAPQARQDAVAAVHGPAVEVARVPLR